MNQTMNQTMNQSMNQTMNQTINDTITKLIDNISFLKNKQREKINLILDSGSFNGGYLIGSLYFLKELEQKEYIQIDKISGEAFNIGGGWENSLSLIELLEFLESFFEIRLRYVRTKWRQEDQKYFVANTQKYRKAVGWRPEISKEAGLKMVLECISKPK